MSPAAREDPRDSLRWRTQAAIAGAGIFVGSFDLGAISDAMRPVALQWHLSTVVVTLLGTVTLLGMLLGSLVAGVLADRIGRRRLILGDVALFVLSSAASALAPDFALLITARVATGLAIGTEFAVVFPFVAEITPVGRGGRAMAWIMLAANFGVLTAYGMGAVFLELSPQGWRITLGMGVFLALPILAMRSRLIESRRWRGERLANLRSIARAVIEPEQRRMLLTTSGPAFLYQVGDQGLTLVLPLLLTTVLTASAASGAAGATLVKVVTIPAALMTVVLIDRLGRRRLQIFGFLGRAVAFGLLGSLLIAAVRMPAVVVGVLLAAGFFFGAAGPDKTTVIVPAEGFNTATRGSGQGLTQASGRLGGMVGVTLYGVLANFGGPGAGILLFAGTSFLGALMTARRWSAMTRLPGAHTAPGEGSESPCGPARIPPQSAPGR